MVHTEIYYNYVIELLLEKYNKEFVNAKPGHCIKISGFPQQHLKDLLIRLKNDFSNIQSYILSDKSSGLEYITATKLIELRNQEEYALAVIVPVNNRTAAEDSFGSATFKDINLSGIDQELFNKLKLGIPNEVTPILQETIQFLDNVSTSDLVSLLISWGKDNYVKDCLGKHIHHIGLIPDQNLTKDHSRIRARLKFNQSSISLLSDFNLSIYDRVRRLPLDKDTIQESIVTFLKENNESRTRKEILQRITNQPNLDFSNWPIPDLNVNGIKLSIVDFKSPDKKIQEGVNIIVAKANKASKIKIRVTTNKELSTIQELAHFRVLLMLSNGGAGELVQELKKIKNTKVKQSYKDLNVTLDPSIIAESAYFIQILAEDENGVRLNIDDDFKEDSIQRSWKEMQSENPSLEKTSINAKLTSDSDDFYFTVDETDDLEGSQDERLRRDKLDNLFQAYFKYRSYLFRNGQALEEPKLEEGSGVWIGSIKDTLNPVFHARYDSRHDFQINFSGKLYQIERTILDHSHEIGSVIAVASNNPMQIGLSSIKFESSHLLNSLAPSSFLESRKALFDFISNSAGGSSGVLATSSTTEFYNLCLLYTDELNRWLNDIKAKLDIANSADTSELKELNTLFVEVQKIDTVSLETRLEDNQVLKVKLLSPLHPLRLAWFTNLINLFSEWENLTILNNEHRIEWYNKLDKLFLGVLAPDNNPLVLVESETAKAYQYSGEISFGWGIYLLPSDDAMGSNTLTSVSRQIKIYISSILNIQRENRIDTDVSQNLVSRYLRNYLIQHPYSDMVVINLFNAGDATVFANSLLELEGDVNLNHIRYEVRLFKGEDNIISHGDAFRNLLNPEFNISEHAEAFTQPTQNRLFPKLRFSINSIKEYLEKPHNYSAHLSFIVSPFPSRTELYKPQKPLNSFYLSGLITNPVVEVNERGSEIEWNKYVNPNISQNTTSNLAISLFDTIQSFIACSLASRPTKSIPSTRLILREADKVLINNVHDFSDWVITFDKHLGPEVYDLPGKDGDIPFLLDYVPGEEISGISSFLTTRPTSEIIGLLGPHFKEYDIPFDYESENRTLKMLLEDLRAISSSLIMQLNSSRNKAFEVIGAAFTKRVLEKKGILKNAFLIPIDLHQNLFLDLPDQDKSRADNLLVNFNLDKKEIVFTVIEVKCRKSLTETEREGLKEKMSAQITNTISALKFHFDKPILGNDILSRELKNKELKTLLEFYIKRALRYEHLDRNTCEAYINFLQTLDNGFIIQFKELGIIYDFSSSVKQKKEVQSDVLTFFTFGSTVIKDILNPDSDLNTKRLQNEAEVEFVEYFDKPGDLSKFMSQFKPTTSILKEPEIELLTPTIVDQEKEKIIIPIKETLTVKDLPRNIEVKKISTEVSHEKDIISAPPIDILIGDTSDSSQYGIIGKTIQSKIIAIDANKTNTISLFGVQGGGKSYTIGTIIELMLKQLNNINCLPAPLAGVIFHFSETMDYGPEATSMIYPNDKVSEIELLRKNYGAEPDNLEDIILLTPVDKIEERRIQYPSIRIEPIAFNSNELKVQDWMFLLGAIGNDATYVRQLKAIMRDNRDNISIDILRTTIENSTLLTNSQRSLALQRLNFASHYIDDKSSIKDLLAPGRLLIVDMRDEFIEKDEALGLFVIMLNIFSGVKEINGKAFNKFIVFDEAHKYMNNKDLTENIVTAIREMRHKGVSILIASQDPPSLPNEIIELSSVVLLHKFNSPQWLKHIQKSITQLGTLNPADLSSLQPGEAFLWATKSTDKLIMTRPIKIITRQRVTKHGGGTIEAI
jgi:DNA phosphorothioation-dependent restriction protein DptH